MEEHIQLNLLLLEQLAWNQTLLWWVEQNYNLDKGEYQKHIIYNQVYFLDKYYKL